MVGTPEGPPWWSGTAVPRAGRGPLCQAVGQGSLCHSARRLVGVRCASLLVGDRCANRGGRGPLRQDVGEFRCARRLVRVRCAIRWSGTAVPTVVVRFSGPTSESLVQGPLRQADGRGPLCNLWSGTAVPTVVVRGLEPNA